MSEREFLTEAHADDLEGALKAFLRSHGFHDAAALVGTEIDDARQDGYCQGRNDADNRYEDELDEMKQTFKSLKDAHAKGDNAEIARILSAE